AERARHAKTGVVGHDQQNVRRTFRWYHARRPPWFGILSGFLDHAAEFRIRWRQLFAVNSRSGSGRTWGSFIRRLRGDSNEPNTQSGGRFKLFSCHTFAFTSCYDLFEPSSLAQPVVAAGGFESFDVVRRQLRALNCYCELTERAGELERTLVVLVVHGC